MTEAGEGRFQILSLDGGGLRGLYSAAVLAGVERSLGVRVADHFDLVAGTSTGGIIALGLGLGFSPAQLVSFYLDDGPRIFPRGDRLWRRARHYLKAKYTASELVTRLQRVFGEKRLGDSHKGLVIPYYSLDSDKPCVFKTRHHPDFYTDHDLLAWQVAAATSAAPTYLPASAHVGPRHIDGGVWANNPALVGVLEARRLGVPLESVRVLSVGTTQSVDERSRGLDNGGLLRWAMAAPEVLLRAQSLSVTNQVKLLIGQRSLHRHNPHVPASMGKLDVLLRDSLSGRAWQGAKELVPVFKEEFATHRGLAVDDLYKMGEAAKRDAADDRVAGPV